MPVLDNLKQLNEKMKRVPHPLAGESAKTKTLYATGVGMMASSDDVIDGNEKAYLENLLLSMDISGSTLPVVIASATEGAETTILALVQSMKTLAHKYAFALDLLAMMRVGESVGAESKEKLKHFVDLMGITTADVAFIATFSSACATKSEVLLSKALMQAQKDRVYPEPALLKYFYPEITPGQLRIASAQ